MVYHLHLWALLAWIYYCHARRSGQYQKPDKPSHSHALPRRDAPDHTVCISIEEKPGVKLTPGSLSPLSTEFGTPPGRVPLGMGHEMPARQVPEAPSTSLSPFALAIQ